MLALLRHFPVVAAFLVLCVLEMSTDRFLISKPYFSVPIYLGMSLFVGVAFLIWLLLNGKRPKAVEEKRD